MKERNACGLEDMDVLSSSLKRVTARCGKAAACVEMLSVGGC